MGIHFLLHIITNDCIHCVVIIFRPRLKKACYIVNQYKMMPIHPSTQMMFSFHWIAVALNLVFTSSNVLKIPEPKFCFKCKYFLRDDFDIKYSRCRKYPKYIEPQTEYLVTGIHETKYPFCTIVRNSQDLCGQEAFAYIEESKETLRTTL